FEHLRSVARELRRTDAGNGRQLRESDRPSRRDLLERRVVEDDVRRDLVLLGTTEPPLTQRVEALRRRRPLGTSFRTYPELAEETAGLPHPRDREPALRARHADVEEPALLGELVIGSRLLRRKLPFLEPRQADKLELEPLRAVVGEEVDTAPLVALRAEPPLELVAVFGRRHVAELVRERHEPRQVVLPGQFPLAEPFGQALEPAGRDGDRPDLRGGGLAVAQLSQHEPRGLARQE